MESVTLDRNGTAYKARIKVAGMEMAGKTGTAQVKSLEGGSEEPKDCLFKTIPTANIAYFGVRTGGSAAIRLCRHY